MTAHTYVSLIHKDADSDYGVSFPDLPGCVTAGRTVNEAFSMTKEALTLHVENMLEHGEEIPAATPADKIDRGDALLMAAIDATDVGERHGSCRSVPSFPG
jgi:predicted RNase H-like HicB family nuclease